MNEQTEARAVRETEVVSHSFQICGICAARRSDMIGMDLHFATRHEDVPESEVAFYCIGKVSEYGRFVRS